MKQRKDAYHLQCSNRGSTLAQHKKRSLQHACKFSLRPSKPTNLLRSPLHAHVSVLCFLFHASPRVALFIQSPQPCMRLASSCPCKQGCGRGGRHHVVLEGGLEEATLLCPRMHAKFICKEPRQSDTQNPAITTTSHGIALVAAVAGDASVGASEAGTRFRARPR